MILRKHSSIIHSVILIFICICKLGKNQNPWKDFQICKKDSDYLTPGKIIRLKIWGKGRIGKSQPNNYRVSIGIECLGFLN